MPNENNTPPLPLSGVIKDRRTTLGLTQEAVAESVQVTPEAVCLWEREKRRIDLDRIPRLAAILEVDEEDLCRLALFEHYPCLHAALFGAERPPQPRYLEA